MKGITLVLGILFLLFSCKPKDEPVISPPPPPEVKTSIKEVTYVEKDSTTPYLGQGTVKLTSYDTLINSVCSGSALELENLVDKIAYISLFTSAGNLVDSVAVGGRSKFYKKLDLCRLYGCSQNCPTAETALPLIKVRYQKDYVFVPTDTTTVKYTEKDTTSSFFGIETLKLTIIRTNQFASNKLFCAAFRVVEVENLTNKNANVQFGGGVWILVGSTQVAARQKVNLNIDLCPFFCGTPLPCAPAENVPTRLNVTYN